MRSPRRRTGTAAAAIAVLTALLLPSAALAAGQISEARARVADIKADLKKTGRAYLKVRYRLEDTRADIVLADKRIAQTRRELSRAQALLGVRMAAMYRTGGSFEYLSLLLGSSTFEEMVTRMEYMRRIGQADADVVARVVALDTKLRADRSKLAADRRRYEREFVRMRRERDRVQAKLERQQAEYERLVASLPAPVRQAVVSSSPRGPNGMVFPVAGACYYQGTWGAARSGGRSHKGTDIMAARGVPCVAIVSGTVRAKEGGLGGKVIWLTGDNGWTYYYAHLNSWAVTSGRVSAGQVIGYVGDSGNARGGATHLHFEIHPGGGGAVDPYPYLRAAE